jgi:hypothetical protein
MATTTFTGPVVSQRGFQINNASGNVDYSLITLGILDVGALPAASAANLGAIVFSPDCRKAAEGAAAGTGNLVFSDGTNWIRVDTGAVAAA